MNKEQNVLVISDLHIPFEKPGYFEFCVDQYYKYNCNKVIFIGDIIDNHYSSYHEVDQNAFGAKYELELAIQKVQRWVKQFPVADVCIGNHDALISRKAQTGGIPEAWIKSYSEVLGAPQWTFKTDFIYDNVRYSHGHKSGKARTGHKRDMHSLVTGHYHTDMYIDWNHGIGNKTFGMSVGAGADDTTYNTNYAQGGKKTAYGCGVVLQNGTLPIVIPMDVNKYEGAIVPPSDRNALRNDVNAFKPNVSNNNYSSKKQIIDDATGKIYDKQKDVQEYLGLSKGYLSSMLNGRLPNKTTFRYLD